MQKRVDKRRAGSIGVKLTNQSSQFTSARGRPARAWSLGSEPLRVSTASTFNTRPGLATHDLECYPTYTPEDTIQPESSPIVCVRELHVARTNRHLHRITLSFSLQLLCGIKINRSPPYTQVRLRRSHVHSQLKAHQETTCG